MSTETTTVPPMAIGSDIWPGLAKLAEECGELIQVIGKLAAYPKGEHPDGGPLLVVRLADEMADVHAAIEYTIEANRIDDAYLYGRVQAKRELFDRWHAEERAA